ncbi:MAG: hypothetical protein HPY76_07985, partial [Anaerolineae bacterium]|nr:hypothetical protein [Anaerolineae bacterium]
VPALSATSSAGSLAQTGAPTATVTPVAPGTVAGAVIQAPPAAAPSPTPEPDPRPAPQDWRAWDVLPWVSQRAVEIYRRGLALGNDPRAFSVVGDCQAIQEVFLGLYERESLYHLDASNRFLQETIDQFDGSFGRMGYAVRGGYSAASILSPLQADPEGCQPGETPLACEIRRHNPSILVISLEVWFDPATVDRYEEYLRAILDLSIERGILPILINKADMNEGDQHIINPVLAQLAHEYRLPLANFWRAAQSLPNYGIDPQREGFHLSQEGYWMKSLVGLQSLDLVWRAAQADRTAVQPSPTPSMTATGQPTAEVVADFSQLCSGRGEQHPGCAMFDLVLSQDGQASPNGIRTIDLETGQVEDWAPPGYRLQDISPDRAAVLVSQGSLLYLVSTADGAASLLSSRLSGENGDSAVFLGEGGDIAWLESGAGGVSVQVKQRDGVETVTPATGIPARLLPGYLPGRLALELRQDCGQVVCPSLGYWLLDLTGDVETHLAGVLNPVFSPDQSHYAFMDELYQPVSEYAFNDRLLVEAVGQPQVSRRLFRFQDANGFLSRNRMEGYFWSPDGAWLLVWVDEYSNYYERSSGIRTYLIKMSTGMTWEYERVMGLMPRAAWSADGETVWLASMNYDASSGSAIRFHRIDRITREEQDLLDQAALRLPGYQYIENLYWLPALAD